MRETILPISLILVLVLFIFLAFLNFNKLIIFYVFTKLNPTFQWKIMILLFLLQTLFGVTCTLGTIFYNDLFKSFHERPCKNCNYYFFRYLWTSLYIVLAICGSICMVSTLVRSYHLVKLVNILVLSLILALFWLLFLQYPLSWTIWLLALEVNTLTYCYINSTDFSNSISVQQATTETFQGEKNFNLTLFPKYIILYLTPATLIPKMTLKIIQCHLL